MHLDNCSVNLISQPVDYLFTVMSILSINSQMVEGVGKATAAAVRGLQASSEFLSRKIIQGGTAVKNNTAACTEPKPVSDTTKKRYQLLKIKIG